MQQFLLQDSDIGLTQHIRKKVVILFKLLQFLLLFVNVFSCKIRHRVMAITAIPFSLLMASPSFCTFSLSKKGSTLSRKNYFLHRFCALQSRAVGTSWNQGAGERGHGPPIFWQIYLKQGCQRDIPEYPGTEEIPRFWHP